MADKRILGPPMEIIGFCGVTKSTEGYLQLAIEKAL